MTETFLRSHFPVLANVPVELSIQAKKIPGWGIMNGVAPSPVTDRYGIFKEEVAEQEEQIFLLSIPVINRRNIFLRKAYICTKPEYQANMRKLTFFLLGCLLSTVLYAQSDVTDKNVSSGKTYTNPLPVAVGDPFVLHASDGKYYLYGTGGGAKDGFSVYVSKDLVDWKYEGQVYYGNKDSSWCTGAFWAPEVYEHKGKYYMFYSAQWRHNPTNEKENFKIGVAVADKPTGPFRNLYNRPVFDPGYPIIDANVFFDDNGKIYLYYSRCCYKHAVESEIADWAREKGWYDEIEESWVYGVQLKPDFSGVIGEPVLLLRPPVKMDDKQNAWESRSVTAHEVNRRWTEGSFTFKYNGMYYIMYSANFFGGKYYAVGYATGKSPLGPFTKAANNPVLQKNTDQGGTVSGTGHNSITYSPDGKEMLCVYHARTKATGHQRVVFIDRMEILPTGELVVHGPTTQPQPVPSGILP